MAAPTAPVQGANGSLALNSGSLDTPTWTDMPNVRDVDLELSFSDVEISARYGDGWKMHEPALADLAFSTEHLYDPADTQLATLRTAARGRTAVDMAIMDGPIATSGSQGFRARFKSFKLGRPEMLDGIMSQSFEWKLCYSTIAPTYLTIGS